MTSFSSSARTSTISACSSPAASTDTENSNAACMGLRPESARRRSRTRDRNRCSSRFARCARSANAGPLAHVCDQLERGLAVAVLEILTPQPAAVTPSRRSRLACTTTASSSPDHARPPPPGPRSAPAVPGQLPPGARLSCSDRVDTWGCRAPGPAHPPPKCGLPAAQRLLPGKEHSGEPRRPPARPRPPPAEEPAAELRRRRLQEVLRRPREPTGRADRLLRLPRRCSRCCSCS